MSKEYGGIDGLTRWLGLRWESHDRVRLTIRPELINPAARLGSHDRGAAAPEEIAEG